MKSACVPLDAGRCIVVFVGGKDCQSFSWEIHRCPFGLQGFFVPKSPASLLSTPDTMRKIINLSHRVVQVGREKYQVVGFFSLV